jgi:hypothetical protein
MTVTDVRVPIQVGEVFPGYCGGIFPPETIDKDLRVEAVGVDWVVLRGPNGGVLLYEGAHEGLRRAARYERRCRDREREQEGRRHGTGR